MQEKSVTDMSVEEFGKMLARRRVELVNFEVPSGWYHSQGGRKKGAFGGVFEYKVKKNMRRRYTK